MAHGAPAYVVASRAPAIAHIRKARVGMMALLLPLLLAAPAGRLVAAAGLRPVRPYRAWCWNAHHILSDHPVLYKGVNLDLLPGGGSNATVAQIENQHGIATLHYAEGAEEPWYGQLKVRTGQVDRPVPRRRPQAARAR